MLSGGKTLDCDTPCNLQGNLITRTVDASGTTGTIDVDGDFIIENTYSDFTAPGSGATFTIAGGFRSDITSGSFDANGGTITFDAGTGTQDLNVASPITFYTLAVTSGSTLVETQAGDNVSITTIDNNGSIQKSQSVSGTGTKTFGLTGVEIEVTTHSGLSELQVEHVGSSHTGATSRIGNGQYWTITPTGLSLSFLHVYYPLSQPPIPWHYPSIMVI
ncbi:MAG: hypothetical protein MAG431_01059 [Chloroflexi bacterium]|nr:hypothetical protein [Chloroflexota bacterium]